MQKQILSRQRPHERGQTMIFVAISLVSLLAMAALAIDIVTLYVARSEIQRAADAAALAGAKAIADSGVTSLDTASPNLLAARGLAQQMATSAVTALINPSSTVDLVAGAPPTLTTPLPIPIDFARQGNPHVTISLQRLGLPTFFSKIWARSAASVTATATAEAYNPANLTTITPITPIAPQSVKPWLVANADPITAGVQLVNTTTWIVDSGLIGQPIDLVSDCKSLGSCATLFDTPPTWTRSPRQIDYLPALVTAPGAPNPNVCPACAGATDYENSIECADVTTSYKVVSCGGGAANAQWDPTINPGAPPLGNNATALGAECLIHAAGAGPTGQDLLDASLWPGSPMKITAQSGPQNGKVVTTSSSIVTIPIFDSAAFNPAITTVTVIGYLQAFINQVDSAAPLSAPPAGSINITVLNIVGCSSANNGANPVVGGAGTSPVPVRLITPP